MKRDIFQKEEKLKKRMVFVVSNVLTLMCSAYYASIIKKFNANVETALIWRNPTSHKIDLSQIKGFFDVVFEIPSNLKVEWNKIIPVQRLLDEKRCRDYMHTSGIYQYLIKKYDRDILMVSADYPDFMRCVVDLYHWKSSPKRIILLEEGMGIYSDKRKKISDIFDFNKDKDVKPQPVIGGCRRVQVIFAQHPEKIPEWKCKHKKVIRQSDVFADKIFWERILRKNNYLNELSTILEDKKVVLYLGQPIHQCSDKFRPGKEINLIKRILEKLPDDFVMLLKAHPRDAANKYKSLQKYDNCLVFDRKAGWYPIESLIHLFDVSFVVTFSSSGALNLLDRIQECSAIYTYKYFEIPVMENWDEIFRSYGDRVRILKSLDEIDASFFDEPGMMNCFKNREKEKNGRNDLRYLRKIFTS